MKRSITASIIAGMLSATLSGPLFASDDHDRAKALHDSGKILPLENVIEKAKKDRPGRVVETELEQKGERYVYEIKLLDEQGRLWELKYDAVTGKQLKEERER